MNERERALLRWARRNGLNGTQARRLLKRERKDLVGRTHLYDQATSFIPCCGRWYPVVKLPQMTPCCGTVHRLALKRTALDERGIDYSSAKEPWRAKA
jgi:hypothetical protein